MYELRNTLLGIKATTKRKLIRGRYNDNLAALTAILNTAASNHIQVLVYITPIRHDVDIPYVETEYTHFKQAVLTLTAQYGATYANLEDLVPAELWGSKNTTSMLHGSQEIDFMHFQAGGHQLLAVALAQLIAHMPGAKA